MSLDGAELDHLRSRLRREPTPTEISIVSAEWSEHCSYKSSRRHLRVLPTSGPRVVREKGHDSGALDAGGGCVVTVHIESHNHPSAVDPYGGAATGVGGVIRDILSSGTRPVAVLDGLRFGDIESDPHAAWLLRGAVSGIAHYGNCIGVPTVGGEVGSDPSYAGYAVVDVAAVGFGARKDLIKNRASTGDVVVLMGGPTGMDGVGGAEFASDQLEGQDRSAVQIPDPFAEKMIIEAFLEANAAGIIRAAKDLGGGGLSCAVSETADALGVGIEMDARAVHLRGDTMSPRQIMTSESQERMMVIVSEKGAEKLRRICARYRVAASAIGRVTGDGMMRVTDGGKVVAEMPAETVANAQPIDRPASRPAYIDRIPADPDLPRLDPSESLLRLLGSPNISSKESIYRKYDHEVGLRTVAKPGGDAAVLRMDNGRFLAISMDGNPKHCYVNPRDGAAGCFDEACRNVACAGAAPAGMVDHLQFGDPGDPGVFWCFLESLRGIAEYARGANIPCVGGKVSLYNETSSGPIKPSPVICVLGFSDSMPPRKTAHGGDRLVAVGYTRDEMGGSEYFEYVHGIVAGRCPRADPAPSAKTAAAVAQLVRSKKVKAAHDCSNGGLAVALAEMCVAGNTGCSVKTGKIPSARVPDDRLLFSESHSRYLLAVEPGEADLVVDRLRAAGARAAEAGAFGGGNISFERGGKEVAGVSVDKAREAWSGDGRR